MQHQPAGHDAAAPATRRPKIDTGKLAALREKHARLHSAYRAAAERARDLAKDVSLLIVEISFGADREHAPIILARNVAALAATPEDEITLARLDPRAVRRVIAAKAAAARQRVEVEALAVELRDSTHLVNRLNDYAQRFETSL